MKPSPALRARCDERERGAPPQCDPHRRGRGAALRISVKGGGCSGFQYAFDIDRTRAEDDVAVTRDGAIMLVDPISLEMLKGAELDFVDDLMGQSFRVKTRMRSPLAAAG